MHKPEIIDNSNGVNLKVKSLLKAFERSKNLPPCFEKGLLNCLYFLDAKIQNRYDSTFMDLVEMHTKIGDLHTKNGKTHRKKIWTNFFKIG